MLQDSVRLMSVRDAYVQHLYKALNELTLSYKSLKYRGDLTEKEQLVLSMIEIQQTQLINLIDNI